jgi:lipoic acid synthetase
MLVRPEWLRVKIPSGENFVNLKNTLRDQNLKTVCEEASCPNKAECWSSGNATIMLMGKTCTRGCKFCDVTTGRPSVLDPLEPLRVAQTLQKWNLKYVVITSVCRDDLEDGGAQHFAETVRLSKLYCPKTMVETLIPDFDGKSESIGKIVKETPLVISHNIETVKRLTPEVRDFRADYQKSLSVLKTIKEQNSRIFTKSSLMLGLGETEDEVIEAAKDLRKNDVDIITLGQYLQPSRRHLPVKEFIPPEKFELYKKMLQKMEFLYVVAGPLVRSSYKALDFVNTIRKIK